MIPTNTKGRFNLTKFLKVNAGKCNSMRKVWNTKKTVTSQKTQISRGIVELETIYNNLQIDKLLIKKWRDLFVTKRAVINTKLLGLGDLMSTYNGALSEMARSFDVGEFLAHTKRVIR